MSCSVISRRSLAMQANAPSHMRAVITQAGQAFTVRYKATSEIPSGIPRRMPKTRYVAGAAPDDRTGGDESIRLAAGSILDLLRYRLFHHLRELLQILHDVLVLVRQ